MIFSIDNIFLIFTIIIIVLVLGIFTFENLNFVKAKVLGLDNLEESDDEDSNCLLGSIFYLYNHDNEKDWLRWINKQSHETRVKAALMICKHLEGDPKFWGYITLEAIECLKGFKDLLIDHKLAAFIHKTSKIWQEYKSIPSYYEKAASILAKINPDSAVEHFKEELDKQSTSQTAIEKKRILINILPVMREKSKDLMIDILSSSSENFGIKSHALRLTLKFPKKIREEILLETFKKLISKHKVSSRSLKTEELHFIQDLIYDSISLISKKEFFDVFNEACYIYQLQKIITELLIKYLNDNSKKHTSLEYYASSQLQDNKNHDLKKTLAKIQNLTSIELDSLILQPTVQDISETSLRSIPIDETDVPIPKILKKEYDEFKNLFFKNIDEFEVVTSEKIFGGVLVTGTDDIEKLYFTKALAKEKNWNFGFIDIANIDSRESYQKTIEIFSILRKPYVLYIKNPHLFYSKINPDTDSFREKFAQTLGIQSLDSKSFLVGDINIKMEETKHSDMGETIRNLKYKYFPQSIEINKRSETSKNEIVGELLKNISSLKLENKDELWHELSKNAENLNSIEFIFFVMRTLSLMLLVFGQSVPYNELKKIEERFKSSQSETSLTDPEEIKIENKDSLETEIVKTSTIQTEQVQEPQNQLDS